MPELPEVETTLRGVLPHVLGKTVSAAVMREPRLRWPITPELGAEIAGQRIDAIQRRAKYLLFRTRRGTLLIHLGMSGSLRVLRDTCPAGRHEHFDLTFDDGSLLRYCDPRRFGAVLWTAAAPEQHPLLRHLGPEPFDPSYDGGYLFRVSRARRVPVKSFIMNAHVIAGVGNIYASEALFRAAIAPLRSAGRISRQRYHLLWQAITAVLGEAVASGGTTLRDFVDSTGRPGYFSQSLAVYGRGGEPCPRCLSPIRVAKIGQRATYYCAKCQR